MKTVLASLTIMMSHPGIAAKCWRACTSRDLVGEDPLVHVMGDAKRHDYIWKFRSGTRNAASLNIFACHSSQGTHSNSSQKLPTCIMSWWNGVE